MHWLNKKVGGSQDELLSEDEAKDFLAFLTKNGITSLDQITDELYYDWVDTKI